MEDHRTLLLLMLTAVLHLASPDEVDLYNTQQMVDYEWTTFSKFGTTGWRKQTVQDRGQTQQVYTSCDIEVGRVENWVRLPYIPRRGANQVLIEMAFSVQNCQSPHCRQNFELYLYESDSDTESAWSVETLKLISLVNARQTYNGTLPSHALDTQVRRVPVSKAGFFISIVERGACVTLHRVLVFYLECPATKANMASFPATPGGPTLESEVLVLGQCVEHAVPQQPSPSALCQSDGQLIYFQGSCACDAGYQEDLERPNTCVGCPAGQYKDAQGTHLCTPCPQNSHSVQKGAKICPCLPGYIRDPGAEASIPCRRGTLPSTTATISSPTEENTSYSSGSDDVVLSTSSAEIRTTETLMTVSSTENAGPEGSLVTHKAEKSSKETHENVMDTTAISADGPRIMRITPQIQIETNPHVQSDAGTTDKAGTGHPDEAPVLLGSPVSPTNAACRRYSTLPTAASHIIFILTIFSIFAHS